MSINTKLSIPVLLGVMIILVFIEAYWKPVKLESGREAFGQHIHELLVLGESEIVRNLLERDLASLYAGMEYLDRAYQNRWYHIQLFDDKGKRLYPLFDRDDPDSISELELISINYPLNVEGTQLGKITLDADWGSESQNVIREIDGIRDMLIFLILLALLVTLISQYQLVSRPLKRLGKAADGISRGDFDIELPVYSNDEIGELTRTFNKMLVELEFQKYALDEHAIVSATDNQGLITYANDRFLKISKYSSEELVGKTHRLVKSEKHSKEFYKQLWQTISSGHVWKGEICNRSKDGEIYWVHSTIVPFINHRGKCERYLSIRTDITQQKKVEEDLKLAKEAAESAYRAKSDFLANMSHEIRTPMNAIIGFSDMAMKSHRSPDELNQYLNNIQNSSRILLNLINDILDLSKLESGKMRMESICFNLASLIDEVQEVSRQQIGSKDLRLSAKFDSTLPAMVIGDPGRVRQVLLNLVDNAIKFTERGKVAIEVKADSKSDCYHFSVADTGIGMEDDQLGNIFESFTQADVSTTRRFGGTGLGTTISKQIVEQLGGRIWAESELGKGSVFHFLIAFAEADEQAVKQYLEAVESQDDYASPRLFKVLLAEDVEANATLVQLRLQQMGA